MVAMPKSIALRGASSLTHSLTHSLTTRDLSNQLDNIRGAHSISTVTTN